MKKFSMLPDNAPEFKKFMKAFEPLVAQLKTSRIVQLQVNVGTGAWRTVMDFEVDDADDVMDLAEKLFTHGITKSTKGIQLRIMKPNDTRPLMCWCENDGWHEWRRAA